MRTLVIAGLAMVTAISATPAAAQRTLSNGQVWQHGRIVPPATVSPNPPSFNRGPGVTWGPGPVSNNPPPRILPNPPQMNTPPRMSNPPRNGQWSGGGQWRGNGQWQGGNMPPAHTGGGYNSGPRPGSPGGVRPPMHTGGGYNARPRPGYNQHGQGQHRWGNSVGGRWYGGSNAPGGWNAYRRPNRGWTLPRYWIAPSFFIGDYGLYGLSTPPYGYNWTRYYDDAVLTDSRGRVYDSVNGIDWDSYDDSYGYGEDYAYGGGSAQAEAGYGYAAAAGGGGGGYGAGYAPPPVQYTQGPPPHMVQNGYTQTYSSGSAGGYVSGGYWYPPVTTTTVTVQTAPVVTTTTTEYVETSYQSARRVYKAPKRTWRPKSKVRCLCN